MMARPFDVEAIVANYQDPFSREQARISFEFYNELWFGKNWRAKLRR